jgi:hypothetical protein
MAFGRDSFDYRAIGEYRDWRRRVTSCLAVFSRVTLRVDDAGKKPDDDSLAEWARIFRASGLPLTMPSASAAKLALKCRVNSELGSYNSQRSLSNSPTRELCLLMMNSPDAP